jgi:hypothetical protein
VNSSFAKDRTPRLGFSETVSLHLAPLAEILEGIFAAIDALAQSLRLSTDQSRYWPMVERRRVRL